MFFDKVLGYNLIRINLLSDISGKQNSVFEIYLKNKFKHNIFTNFSYHFSIALFFK